jgi:PAS domain S-box-containing protein
MRVILTGVAVVVLVAGIFLARPNWVAKLDDKACDLVTGPASRGRLSGRVAIVEIDESSLAQLGRWPWPRDLLGLLVKRILDRGAVTVVLDMMLHEEDRGNPSARSTDGNTLAGWRTNDEALAGVLSGRPVALGYAFRFDGAATSPPDCQLSALPLAVVDQNESWRTGFFHASGALCSVPQISKAAEATGFLNAAPDIDGKLRRIPLVIEYSDRQYASLALAAYHVYRRHPSMRLNLNTREASRLEIGTQVVRLEGPSSMRLRFRGPRRTFPYYSAASVMNDQLPARALDDKVAVVGGSALGLPNSMATPTDALFPDIEIEATAIDNLLQSDSLYRPADLHLLEVVLALLGGLVTTWLLVAIRSWWPTLVVFGMVVGTWGASVLLLSRMGLLLSPLPVAAALACSFPIITLLNYLSEKKRAERTEGQLAEAQEYSQEVLRESAARYQRLVENINDAIIMDDAEGRLVFANRRFREWFGLEGRDIRKVVLDDYVAPEWLPVIHDWHAKRMNGSEVTNQYEYEGIRPDGTRIWIEALVTNIEEDGRIVGTQAALRDVTERKKMEAQYLQAQKMEGVGRLAGVVAHDFNNLLTVINGYSDMLLTWDPEEKYAAGLKQIRAAGERAAELTRNLLSFSRKQRAQPKVLDLNRVVAEAEKMFERLMGEDVELITRLSPALGKVMVDAGQLQQILMNLLVNARDAMPRGGRVMIETKNIAADEDFLRLHPGFEPGAFVYLGVTDTGMGMSDEVMQHLFEPFFTTKEPGKGTGLGLATIYAIVQQNEGKIEVSTGLGKGTTFHIFLPRVEAEQPVSASATGPTPVFEGSETVLVVEDQEAVRQYIRAVLEQRGYRVLQAADGTEALSLANRFSGTIHLLLTDLVMPVMNGRELAEKLKTTRPAVKVLFMSGYADETIDSRGIGADDLAYLAKPFGPEGLTERVREVLGKPRGSDSANRTRSTDGAVGT